MKHARNRPVKTEESLDRQHQKTNANAWVYHSVLKKHKKMDTPLRFADFIHQKPRDLASTNDREANPSSLPTPNCEISKAINVLKDNSGKQSGQYEHEDPGEITPFSLTSELEDFEVELSFKGASNRLHLLAKLDQIEQDANRIFQAVQHLNRNSSIDFITFKLLKTNQHDLNLSYYDFYTHLEVLAKRVGDFVTELNRCRHIMSKISVGISKRTMELYINKFEDLVKELKRSLEHLQHYVDLLGNLQKKEKRNAKKLVIGHKGGPISQRAS